GSNSSLVDGWTWGPFRTREERMTDKTSFDIATRVAAGDDGTNYDAFVHAMEALYHHYVLRDRVLARMFPPARRQAVF
ncbi:MAG TPA: hypothetical protein VM711_08695, partial [Sphingomicrobium sp.]|nr:hypothetical protein [Sphingomicrobium sp.]